MAEPSLVFGVDWLIRLRWIAVAGVVLVVTLADRAFGLVSRPGGLYAGAVLLGLGNLAFMLQARRLRKRPPDAISRHVLSQIGLDLVALTVLIHYAGGPENPFVFFYLFHTVIAAILLPRPLAFGVANGALVLLAATTALELLGALPHHPLAGFLPGDTWHRPLFLFGLGTVLALTLNLSVYFVSTISERLRGREAELLRVKADLESTIETLRDAEKTERELRAQLVRSEKLISLGTLAAGVAHEINNPVGVILARLGVLEMESGESIPEGLRADLLVLKKHALRIAAITRDLLAFAKEHPLRFSPTDVHGVVRNAASLAEASLRAAGIRLETRLDAPSSTVFGSENHLEQVFVNLFSNARDAMPEGGSLTVETACDERGGALDVFVTDTGTGIRPEDVERIFDPFFTTKPVGEGTGLGLSISHGIVEKHRGTISVSSESGRGTTFRIRLPLLGDSERA